MTVPGPEVVYTREDGVTLAQVMAQLRSWLDNRNIATTGFDYKFTASGKLELRLLFTHPAHAKRFEDEVCRPGQIGTD